MGNYCFILDTVILFNQNAIFYLQGLLGGLLLMMMVYNMFLYLSSRDKSYLYYVLYVLFTFIFIGFIDKVYTEFEVTLSSTLLNLLPVSILIAYVFYILLMKIFVQGNTNLHKLTKYITIIQNTLIVAVPILIFIALFKPSIYNITAQYLSALTIIPVCVIMFLMLKKGNKESRVFVYGSLLLFAGNIFIITGLFIGINEEILMLGVKMGIVSQIFIFSMSLSYRYERLNIEYNQAKQNALKSQIDPHFFYNSLSVLTSLVYKDADKSADYITELARVYRNILSKKTKNLVSLEYELQMLSSYIYLQTIRFENLITFDIDIADDTKTNNYIPPHTLQLLVENAIKHNKCSLDSPLTISIFQNQDRLILKNNLNKKTLLESSSGIGLENIKKRLLPFTSREVIITEDEQNFTVSLPLLDEKLTRSRRNHIKT